MSVCIFICTHVRMGRWMQNRMLDHPRFCCPLNVETFYVLINVAPNTSVSDQSDLILNSFRIKMFFCIKFLQYYTKYLKCILS